MPKLRRVVLIVAFLNLAYFCVEFTVAFTIRNPPQRRRRRAVWKAARKETTPAA